MYNNFVYQCRKHGEDFLNAVDTFQNAIILFFCRKSRIYLYKFKHKVDLLLKNVHNIHI